MKKTQFIELFSLIRRTLVPFVSIVLFVAMSVTLYAGMTWTATSLQENLDRAFNQQNAYDFCMMSTLGLTDSDLADLRQVEGVTTVEPGYLSYQTIYDDGDRYNCVVHSTMEQVSTLEVVEGTLPSSTDEIALLDNCTDLCGYKVGDTITFDADGEDASTNDGMKYLKNRTFTITALVKSPDYLGEARASWGANSQGRQITCVFFASKDAFAADGFGGAYPCAYITSDGLRSINTFSSEYSAAIENIIDSIKQTGAVLVRNRYDDIKSYADAKITDGQNALDSAKEQIDDGEAQIAAGEQELASKKAELLQGQASLAWERQQYDESVREVEYYDSMSVALKALSDDTVARFTQFGEEASLHQTDPDFKQWITGRCAEVNGVTQTKVATFKQNYPTRPSEVDALLDGLMLDPDDTQASKRAAQNALGLGAAADKIQTDVVQPGREQLAAASDQLSSGQAQVSAGESQIANAQLQLADAENQLAAAKSQYAEGEEQLQNAKTAAGQIEAASWVVNQRNDSYASQMIETTCCSLDSLRLSMSLLFIVVGLLVCYSVMSRLVHENRIQLGTKKALGFTVFEISKLFIGYAFLACAIGIVLGAVVGAPLIELVLFPSVNQFVIDDPPVMFNFVDIIPLGLMEIALICLASWLACRSILKKNAIDLLKDQQSSRAKHRFYETMPFWNRMSLLTQTMVNNCINDKRRVFGTLVGVAGCTALVVCAVTLQGGVSSAMDHQQNVIDRYDEVIYLSDQTNSDVSYAADDVSTVDDLIASSGYTAVQVQYGLRNVDLPDGTMNGATLIVPKDMDDLSSCMTIQVTQGDRSLEEDGVYVSCALANYYHFEIGDELSFGNSSGMDVKVPIVGIFNYYGGTHVVLMNGGTYSTYFGEAPDYSARLVDMGDGIDETFVSLVEAASDFDDIEDSRATTRALVGSASSLTSTVVAIYLGISVLVALFVLLNLDVMFIAEKKRELIVMMINGYEAKDAKRYVSQDATIMDTLGIIVGCLLGTTMGILAVQSLQNDRLAFIASASPFACLVGIVICALLSFAMMHIALRRVDTFRITSIND